MFIHFISLTHSSTFTIRTGPFPMSRMSEYLLIIPCFVEMPVFNANSVDPDQTPRLWRLICVYTVLPMSFLWHTRLKWVKIQILLVLSL